VIAVRVLRDGAVVREVLCPTLPVTLGRGSECDVVLFDPSVSRRHARIEAGEAGPVLRDLGSRNGLRAGASLVDSLPVAGLVRCGLGLAEVEVELLADAATGEVVAPDWSHLERRLTGLDHLRYLALGAAGVVIAHVAEPKFWSPWNQTRMVQFLGMSIGALVALPFLSFILMIALKAAGRRVRFGAVLRTLFRTAWLLLAVGAVTYLGYYLLPASLHRLVTRAVECAVFVLCGVVAVSIGRRGPMRVFRLAWGTALLALWVASAATARLAAERMGQPAADYTVQPPIAGWTGPARELTIYEDRLRSTAAAAAGAAASVRERQGD
jgi:hypothetical protein